MLTCIEIVGVFGISGVLWDVVELLSQFMENWCWEFEVLVFIFGYYEIGELLLKELLDKMLVVKNYQVVLFILCQLEFGLFDFCFYVEFCLDQGVKIFEILVEIKKLVVVVLFLFWGCFLYVFSYIFVGGYVVGYYSYLWVDVLVVDVFLCFEEEGIFNCEIGQLFFDNILSCGGLEELMDLFKCFCGCELQLDVMLEYYGIKG